MIIVQKWPMERNSIKEYKEKYNSQLFSTAEHQGSHKDGKTKFPDFSLTKFNFP